MTRDIVCDEGELSIAANNLLEYADFLVRTMDAYVAVLAEIQVKGIQDDLVCSKLSSVEQSLKPYKTAIIDECEEIAKIVRDYIQEIARADNFKFPSDITAPIATLVAQFS